jgi:hypothetical protein
MTTAELTRLSLFALTFSALTAAPALANVRYECTTTTTTTTRTTEYSDGSFSITVSITSTRVCVPID